MNDGTIVHAGTLFNGSPMVTFDGDGTDILDGGNRATTVETTVNDGNTFEGFQQFGSDNNQVTIDNDAGTYDADVSGEAIVFDTGNTVTNAGLFEASNGGTLEIENSTVANTGTIEAGAGALVDLSHATVDGGVLTDNGTIDVTGSSKIDDNANLTGGVIGIENGQTLKLDDVTVHNSTIEALTVYSFTNVSDPSAATSDFNFASQNFAINNSGEVVGNYGDVNGNYNGFIFSSTGTYTTVSDPNAIQGGSFNNGPLGTTVTGINDSGEVVGYYNSGSGNFAFIGKWWRVHDPQPGRVCPRHQQFRRDRRRQLRGQQRRRRFSIQRRRLHQFERWASWSGRHLFLRHQQFRPGSRRLL